MDSREQEEQKIILQSSVNLANLFYSDQVFMSSSLQLSSQSTSLPSTSSNKHHPVTPESNDEKIRRYRERNRQAAKRSRDRKMAQLKQLEEQKYPILVIHPRKSLPK
ncbi:591_t:CDS:2 [Ambispora gerdemannii]|uniref:591_t:CDS:1 n=1 Tax=Ambispora gerdemannii TaxID=144530 RepID=A0A9N8VVB3_9GLOM|nr:591_t:CDS:2 [Ambispora gerdemannii]